MVDKQGYTWATGRRKTAVARVRIKEGSGKIQINGSDLNDYFGHETLITIVQQPFAVTGTAGKFDVFVNANGGGISGQAGAIRHGIARALEEIDSNFRLALKQNGFLTRDSRMVERKKYGRRGARRRFQFSKR